jgi:hypothetical protein
VASAPPATAQLAALLEPRVEALPRFIPRAAASRERRRPLTALPLLRGLLVVVHLHDSLSNPTEAVQSLLRAVTDGDGPKNAQVRASTGEAVVAQTGAPYPSSVRLEVRENRKLLPGEVEKVVARYKAGASIRSLGEAFGLHEQTVRAHLRRRGVELRPVRALTEEKEIKIVRL